MKSYIIKKTELEKLQKELDEKEKAQRGVDLQKLQTAIVPSNCS